ncbi:MAG: hypothetical protein WCO23_00255 [bacterium]
MLELIAVVAIFTVIAYVIACFLGMQGLTLALTTIFIIIVMVITLFSILDKKFNDGETITILAMVLASTTCVIGMIIGKFGTNTIWVMVSIIAVAISIKIHLSYKKRFVDKKPFEIVDISREIALDCRWLAGSIRDLSPETIFSALGCTDEIIEYYDDKFREYFETYSIKNYEIIDIIAIVNHPPKKWGDEILCHEISVSTVHKISSAGSTMTRPYTFWVTGTLQHPTGVYLPEECKLRIRGEKK